jgi:hypothetical protein
MEFATTAISARNNIILHIFLLEVQPGTMEELYELLISKTIG